MKKVSIIIPYYKSYAYLTNLIIHLNLNTIYPNYEIIIVNDGSDDFYLVKDFIKNIKLKYNIDVKYIDRKENKLFAYTCNEGASAAKGELLHFLNADTIPFKGWLKSLVDFYEENENIGILGSKLIYPELNLIQHIGGEINEVGNPYHLYRFVEPNLPFINKIREVPHSTAASMLVSKKDFAFLGGFDDKEIKHTFEDTDFCFKMRIKLGKKIMVIPKSALYHYENVTGRTTSNSLRSLKIFKKRWKKYLKSNTYKVYENDGFSKELIKKTEELGIKNINFIYHFLLKNDLLSLQKQKEFIKREKFINVITDSFNEEITSGRYHVVNESSAMFLMRNKFLNKNSKGIARRNLVSKLEKLNYFKNTYNFGSYYLLNKMNIKAKELFKFIVEYKGDQTSDIAGKAFFKLALIEEDDGKKIFYLKECLKIIPNHLKAKEELSKLLKK